MADIRQGGCGCGSVRYEVDVTGQVTSNCHCLDCRRHIGAAFATFTMVPLEQFQWLSEPSGEIALSDKARRRFCKKCGTYINWIGNDQADYAEINTATLDDPAGLVASLEIYTKNRMEGVQPVPGAAQYEDDADT